MPSQKIFNRPLFKDLLALIAGVLLMFAFAPFEIFPLAILAPTLLLFTWLDTSKWRAFLRGWLFGVGLFSAGVYWVYISVHNFGNAAIPLALLITGGFIAILGLFPALNGYLLSRYFPKTNLTKLICAFPAIWVLLEWVRSWMFSGFPWLFLGYSQLNSPLHGYAPIFSVYGVSLAVVFTSGLLLNAMLGTKRTQYKRIYYSILALTLLWSIGSALSMVHWTKPNGENIKISLVQGNIPQEVKWSPENIVPTLNHYLALTEKHWDSRLIIWPESAVPLILQEAGSFIEDLSYKAIKNHVALITGIPVESPQPGSYYNAVISLGDATGVYTKQRLVPYGEYVPFHDVFKKFFDILQIPMSDFIPGLNNLKPIQVGTVKIATYICYEIAFPEQVRSQNDGAGLILTVSNDAWFGRSIAQAQHLEMGRMRALETGRPVLFVSNNGITAFIAANGDIQSAAPPFESYVLTDSIKAYAGKTPWQYLGMDPVLMTLCLFVLIAIRGQRY